MEFTQQSPQYISKIIAQRMRSRRKDLHISQAELAKRAGVSLGSIKRFESIHEIALMSLIKIAIVLDVSDDFFDLFTQRNYNSIQEIIENA